MPEIRSEVKEVLIDYLCPKCNIGHLRPTGTVLTSCPPQFPHKCNNCDYMETFTVKQYPYIDYEEIDNQKLTFGVDIATANGDYSSTSKFYTQSRIVDNKIVAAFIIPSNNGNNF